MFSDFNVLVCSDGFTMFNMEVSGLVAGSYHGVLPIQLGSACAVVLQEFSFTVSDAEDCGAVLGCIDPVACNYNAEATVDDASCLMADDAIGVPNGDNSHCGYGDKLFR